MKTFVDQRTGRKFQLGSRGIGALTDRITQHVEEQRAAGHNEIAIHPSNIPGGSKFRCTACNETFEFDGEDQDAFVEGIMDHGRSHGECQILPII